jgi:ATP-dependent RNA helicase RhlE
MKRSNDRESSSSAERPSKGSRLISMVSRLFRKRDAAAPAAENRVSLDKPRPSAVFPDSAVPTRRRRRSGGRAEGAPNQERREPRPAPEGPREPRAERGPRPERAPRREGEAGGDRPPRRREGPSGGSPQGRRDGPERRGGSERRGPERRGGPERRERPAIDPTFDPSARPPRPERDMDVPLPEGEGATAFMALGLSPEIASGVHAMGFVTPTPIQAQAIPLALQGRDLIGSAQTGTGKTAAFALPILQRLKERGKLRCLILEPTRELAAQVESAFHDYSRFVDLNVAVIYGGVGYGPQREKLKAGLDIIVATPGRLLDHMEQGDINLGDIEILVLDEVDRMLDMGFIPDVRRIVAKCPKQRQTLLFTATLPPEIERLTQWVLTNPETIEIGQRRSPAETVSHACYPVVSAQKFDLLIALLERTKYESVLIFTRTKFGADKIAGRLEDLKHSVAVLHSNRSQRERLEALDGFKSGKYEVLVATDIAARGLDIAGISHVVNYDVPLHAEDYVHRIGRTGRANATGDAFTLVTEDEINPVRSIERFIGMKIPRQKLDDFPYAYSAVFEELENMGKPQPASRLFRGARR